MFLPSSAQGSAQLTSGRLAGLEPQPAGSLTPRPTCAGYPACPAPVRTARPARVASAAEEVSGAHRTTDDNGKRGPSVGLHRCSRASWAGTPAWSILAPPPATPRWLARGSGASGHVCTQLERAARWSGACVPDPNLVGTSRTRFPHCSSAPVASCGVQTRSTEQEAHP